MATTQSGNSIEQPIVQRDELTELPRHHEVRVAGVDHPGSSTRSLGW
ncbi:MAG: hypothetical protein ACYDEH_11320 [Acidimicrobiales bacterium]